MSTREPMWFCHECNAEMRPLMVPDPHCASCNGTFVEKMENPSDDPREFQNALGAFDGEGLGSFNFIANLQELLRPEPPSPPIGGRRSQSPTAVPDRSTSPSGRRGGMGLRFEVGGHSGRRAYVVGGPNTLGRTRNESTATGPLPRLYVRANDANRVEREMRIPGPLMAQYLMTILSHGGGRGGSPFFSPFGAGSDGLGGGRMGDYVFSQEALDQILTQLMEGQNSHRPVPATEEIVTNLPREILIEGSPLLEKDCAVCKEQFSLQNDDPDNAVVVTLPCKHPFHEGCIVPWLKSSGTCPVCRHALVAQPDSQPAYPGSGASGSSGSPPRSPTGAGVGASGPSLFSTLFGDHGGGSSSGGGRSGRTRASSEPNNGSSSDGGRHIPGEWEGEPLD